VSESSIVMPRFPIPEHFSKIWGIDFGWQNFGACLLAHDRDTDTIYVVDEHLSKEETPLLHSAALKLRAEEWIPVSWPADGLAAGKSDGRPLRDIYQAAGMRMLGSHATHPDGSVSVEAGVTAILQRMQTGRWKVFSNCVQWIDEFRSYARKDGKINKLAGHDHLLDASRYGSMAIQYARAGPSRTHRGGPRIAHGYEDYNPFDPTGSAQRRRSGYDPHYFDPRYQMMKGFPDHG
jgi:hypothetical protein